MELVYAKARWYAPGLGAFLSVDPVSGTAGAPGTFAPQLYALGNPLRYVDPLGLTAAAAPKELHAGAWNFCAHLPDEPSRRACLESLGGAPLKTYYTAADLELMRYEENIKTGMKVGVVALTALVVGPLALEVGAAAGSFFGGLGAPLVVEGAVTAAVAGGIEAGVTDAALQGTEMFFGERDSFDGGRVIRSAAGGALFGWALGAVGSVAQHGRGAFAVRTPAPWVQRARARVGHLLAEETGSMKVPPWGGAGGGAARGGDDVVDLYRFVSPAEVDDIARTGKFAFGEGMMEAKQFGLNFDEVLRLSDYFNDAAAIVRVRVPRSALQDLDMTSVDAFILRSGSATARGRTQLRLLNESLIGPIEHVF